MADTAYIITRGFQEGKQLTTTQKTSALFAEEPVVLGRVLRRGSHPMRISKADYNANEYNLLRLEKAEAIKIQRPQEEVMTKPCSLCGQVPRGQGGEYKCPSCGLPMVHDPALLNSGAGDTAPLPQESSGAEVSAAAEPPAVIVPPHPPTADPPPAPPVEDPPPSEETPEEPAVVAAQPAEPLAEGSPVPVSLPQQVKSKQRRTRS